MARWAARAWVTLAAAIIGACVVGFLEASGMALVAEPTSGAGRAIAAWAVGAVLLEVFPQQRIPRDLLGVAHGTWKVVWDREANSWSLFSLADDPDDRHDLAAREPDRLAAMRRLLHETADRELARPPGAKPR